MTTNVLISELAQCLDRSESFIRVMLRSLAVEHKQNKIDLTDAVKLIRHFAGTSGEKAKLISELEARLHSTKKRELELSVSVEMLRRERDMLNKQNEILDRQLQKANDRTDRFEAKLHALTDSFAHLVDQRDRLVAQHRSKISQAVEVYENGRPILLLKNPVA